jgi:hypothetical protein
MSAVQSIESWLLVPTVQTPTGLMRVAENDGKPVPYGPVDLVAAAPKAADPESGLMEKLLRKLGAGR